MKTYTARAKLLDKAIDYFQLKVEVLGHDVTNRTTTLHIQAVLYDKEMVFEVAGHRYCRLYINGAVHANLFPFTYYGRQNEPYYIIDKNITYKHNYSSPEPVTVEAKIDFNKYWWFQYQDNDPNTGDASGDLPDGYKVSTTFTLPKVYNSAVLTSVPTFYDNENYTIQYDKLKNVIYDKLEAGIVVKTIDDDDSAALEVVYRDITSTQSSNLGGASYTFQLTENELRDIRQVALYSKVFKAKVYLRTTYNGVTDTSETEFENAYIDTIKPLASNLVIRDVNSTTVGLTGDENILVKGESMVEFSFTPIYYKEAVGRDIAVKNGTIIKQDMTNGIFDNVVSPLFSVWLQDSRYTASETFVTKPFVEYVKPTCYQKVMNEISGEVGAIVKIQITGDYFNGSFGAVDNELILEIRHTQEDGEMGEWNRLTDGLVPDFDGNRYTLDITVSGFVYNQSYSFQCRAIDKLHTVQTSIYTTTIETLFDWGANDFNFNVPVKMHDKTVLRYNKESDNTVLSAEGGKVFIRPGGTDNTTGETTFYTDGSVNFGGDISIRGALFNPGSSLATDYVVEHGTAPMGSNGTWHWTKWHSGKAECWGDRNYGITSFSQENGSPIYSSGSFTQDFPEGLFIDTPLFITMDVNYATTLNEHADPAWIVRGGGNYTVASKNNTGSFCVYSLYNTRLAACSICIHAIGRWKEES